MKTKAQTKPTFNTEYGMWEVKDGNRRYYFHFESDALTCVDEMIERDLRKSVRFYGDEKRLMEAG